MKRTVAAVGLLCALLLMPAEAVEPVGEDALPIEAHSAVLMEKVSGELIFEKNGHERLPPASVTKVMTLLLVMEEIDRGGIQKDDLVTCSAHAASMGGSQIWLEEGEQMTVSDMLKAVTVVSANDCAVALAEHVAGSEPAFVAKMNERARQLGMEDTNFVDCTGLTDNKEHLTTAYDIALMSRQLIMFDGIKEYTTIWMDSLRDGKSELTNTNKLVRFYEGATGLKTGFTSRAKYCLSATAERNGIEYIAVILRADTSEQRFESAKALLNYAFANYAVCPLRSGDALPPVRVNMGTADCVQPVYSGPEGLLVEKGKLAGVEYTCELPDAVQAPVAEGDVIGYMTVTSNGKVLARVELLADREVEALTIFKVYGGLVARLFGG